MEDKMDVTCRRWDIHSKFWSEKVMLRDCLGDLHIMWEWLENVSVSDLAGRGMKDWIVSALVFQLRCTYRSMVMNTKFHKSREFLGKLSNFQIVNNSDAAQYSAVVMHVTLNSLTLSVCWTAHRIRKEAILPLICGRVQLQLDLDLKYLL